VCVSQVRLNDLWFIVWEDEWEIWYCALDGVVDCCVGTCLGSLLSGSWHIQVKKGLVSFKLFFFFFEDLTLDIFYLLSLLYILLFCFQQGVEGLFLLGEWSRCGWKLHI